MKKSLLIFLLLAFSWGAAAAGKPFRSGEKIDLFMYYKWGAVNKEIGSVRFQLDSVSLRGEQVYYSQLTARSNALFDMFYKIREHFHSWFTTDALQPRRYIRETQEGDYSAYNLYEYDWGAGVIHADVAMGSSEIDKMDIPISGEVYDLASIIYYLRTIDYSGAHPGERFPLKFAIDDAVFNVAVTYCGRETKKFRFSGSVDTWHLCCTVVSGALFDGDTQLHFWVSTDGRCLPYAIMVPLRIGAVWAYMK